MGKYTTADLRNIALLGHSDAGKTTLADALLLKSGAVDRKGSVKDGTSHFDFGADEKERQCSLDAASGHLVWQGKQINVIDTPGYPDFIGEAVSGLNGADAALLCVNAHGGVQVNTRRIFSLSALIPKIPCAIVVTKSDLESDGLEGVLGGIREAFGDRCIPWRAPAEVGDFTESWTEAVVESDDELMMRYLEGEAISDEEITKASVEAFKRRIVVPVIFTSCEKEEGVETLLDFIAEMVPAPGGLQRLLGPRSGEGEKAPVEPDSEGPFVGLVWNLQVDRHVGKIAHVRVISGTLKAGDHIVNASAEKKEKVGHILRAQGKDQDQIDAAIPGDLVVLTKLDSLAVGHTLAGEDDEKVLRIVPFPSPMYSLALTPKSRGDEGKISEVLHRLTEECATFTAIRDASTGELVASGISQLHLDLMLRRMKDRFGLEVDTRIPKVPYREAIAGVGESRYRHKKQSGGRGQFAEVSLNVKPGDPGTGLTYSWDIFGGSIPKNFEPAIQKGIVEKMTMGCIAGFAMQDVYVSVTDGKHHDVDSSEAAFKIAGGRAFQEAVTKAQAIILEPIVKLEITIPGQYMGDITGDLNTRRGRIQGMDQEGNYQVLKAEMPLSEAMEYSRVLTSLTSGEGSYTMDPSHYERVPPQIQQELVANYKPHGDDD